VWQSSTRRRFSQSPSVVVLHKKDLSQKLRKCGSLAQEGLAQAELEVWQSLSLRRIGQIVAMLTRYERLTKNISIILLHFWLPTGVT